MPSTHSNLFHIGFVGLYSALIVTNDLRQASKIVAKIKKAVPDMIVISLSANRSTSIKLADHHVSSHDPQALLELCRDLFGDPRKSGNGA